MSNLKQLLVLAGLVSASPVMAQQAYMDFGGMYGSGSGGTVTYRNPYTNAASCPSGYTAYQILGTPNLDNPLYFCGRLTWGGTTPVADFGGLFGYGSPNSYPNPLTGGFSCPAGYTATQVLGTGAVDYPLFFCHKAGTANSQFRLGGMWGGYWAGRWHADYPNPVTGGGSCPINHTSSTALGTYNLDYHVVACWLRMY